MSDKYHETRISSAKLLASSYRGDGMIGFEFSAVEVPVLNSQKLTRSATIHASG